MNHDEAVQSMTAEKYLLNELSPEVRDQFEEHFFGCTDCANDLRAGSYPAQTTRRRLKDEREVNVRWSKSELGTALGAETRSCVGQPEPGGGLMAGQEHSNRRLPELMPVR